MFTTNFLPTQIGGDVDARHLIVAGKTRHADAFGDHRTGSPGDRVACMIVVGWLLVATDADAVPGMSSPLSPSRVRHSSSPASLIVNRSSVHLGAARMRPAAEEVRAALAACLYQVGALEVLSSSVSCFRVSTTSPPGSWRSQSRSMSRCRCWGCLCAGADLVDRPGLDRGLRRKGGELRAAARLRRGGRDGRDAVLAAPGRVVRAREPARGARPAQPRAGAGVSAAGAARGSRAGTTRRRSGRRRRRPSPPAARPRPGRASRRPSRASRRRSPSPPIRPASEDRAAGEQAVLEPEASGASARGTDRAGP